MATTIQTIELPKKYRASDTSGNNNHGQIYSGRGLEFDGVADYLTTPYGSGWNPSTTSLTFACWVYPTEAASAKIFFGTLHSGSTRFYIGTHSGKFDMGIQGSPWINTSTEVAGFSDQPAYNVNTWYRIVIVMDGSQAIMYVNGIKSYAKTYSSYSFDNNFHIGNHGTSATYHWPGMLSNVQVWNTAWTAADVTYDYLNPESLALNRSGTSLTNSNLKLWYPMQDGHRGQQSYILDGANTGYIDKLADRYGNAYGDIEGLEMHPSTASTIIHPTNSNIIFNPYIDTTISLDTNIKYAGEQSLKVVTGSSGSGVYSAKENANDRFSVIAGVAYKISGYIYRESGSGTIKLHAKTGAGGNWDLGATVISPSSNETWEYWEAYYTASVSGDNAYLLIVDTSAAETYYLDNFEWGPINGKNHATTVFYGDELVTNGTFETNTTGWTDASGTTFERNTSDVITGDGDLNWAQSATNAGYTGFYQTAAIAIVTGRTYVLTCTYRVINAEKEMYAKIGDSATTTSTALGGFTEQVLNKTSNTSITYSFTSTESGDFYLIFRTANNEDAEIYIDDISLKEVGVASGWTDADQQLHIPQTALQSYNQLAMFPGTDDGTDSDVDCTADSDIDNVWAGGGTFSAWILPFSGGAGTYGRIVDKGGVWYMILTGESGGKTKLKFYHASGGDASASTTSSTEVVNGQWSHIVATFDSDTMGTHAKIYVNGIEVTTTETAGTGTATTDTTLNLTIGNQANGARTFDGCITEVSLWTTTLTEAQIQELFNDGKALDATTHSVYTSASTNLKGYWRNNGLSTWTDLSTYGNDGTVNNLTETMLLPAGVDATRDNQGFIMNRQKDTSSLNLARDSYSAVLTANSMQDTFRGDFSVGFWMKTTEGRPSNNEYIMGTYNSSGEDYFYLQMRTNGTIRMEYKANNDGFDKYSDVLIANTATGSWHYIVATVEKNASNGLKWYKDGDFSDQDDTTDVTDGNWEAWTSSNNLGIGTLYYIGAFLAAYHFDGKIDNVVFYDDILTAAEVERNYNAGKGSHRN